MLTWVHEVQSIGRYCHKNAVMLLVYLIMSINAELKCVDRKIH